MGAWLRPSARGVQGPARADPYPKACAQILKHGRSYESRRRSRGEAGYVRRFCVTDARYPRKFCFQNAQELVRRSNGTLKYVEGFAVSGPLGVPVHHGWATLNGAVIDPTWKVFAEFAPPAAYFGIEQGIETRGVEVLTWMP